jgi:hypothetical protein
LFYYHTGIKKFAANCILSGFENWWILKLITNFNWISNLFIKSYAYLLHFNFHTLVLEISFGKSLQQNLKRICSLGIDYQICAFLLKLIPSRQKENFQIVFSFLLCFIIFIELYSHPFFRVHLITIHSWHPQLTCNCWDCRFWMPRAPIRDLSLASMEPQGLKTLAAIYAILKYINRRQTW